MVEATDAVNSNSAQSTRPIKFYYTPSMVTSALVFYIALGYFVHGGFAGVFGSIVFATLMACLFFLVAFNFLGVFLQGYIGWIYVLPLFSKFVGYPVTWLELSPFALVLLVSTFYSFVHLFRVFRR